MLATAVLGAVVGAACTSIDEAVPSSTAGQPVISTTTATVALVTTTQPTTTHPVPKLLPLDDLDDLIGGVDSFLARLPDHREVAEELASLNRLAHSTMATLGAYDGDDLVTVEERLAALRGLRQRLADLATELGLEMVQGYELGPALDPLNLPHLPGEGVAVQLMGATVLVDLEGVLWGHLAGFSIDFDSELPGPVKLIDRMGDEFLLAPPAESLIPYEGRIPLGYGAEYVVTERTSPGPEGADAQLRAIVGNDWRHPLGSGETLLSSGRETVTERMWVEDRSLFKPGKSVAVDLATGATAELPEGCWVGATFEETTYLVCRVDSPAGVLLDQVFSSALGSDGSPLVQPPNSELPFPVGHWRWLVASPDGTELLGQWSGECEMPTAFRVPTVGSGAIATITGEVYELAPASHALGWSAEGRAVALLDGSGACTEPAAQPGVHIYSEDGASTWIYDTGTHGLARMWQPLPQLECQPSDYVVEFDAEPATAQLAVWVNIHPVDGTVCDLNLTGTLSIVDATGDPVNVEGSPAEVRLAGPTPYNPSVDDDWQFSQVWIWQNWCGEDVALQLDLDDGFSTQLPSSPRCDSPEAASQLSPLDRTIAG